MEIQLSFFILIFYPGSLLTGLNCNNLPVNTFTAFYDNHSFNFSLPNLTDFSYCSCHSGLTRIVNMLLHRCSNGRHPCLDLNCER